MQSTVADEMIERSAMDPVAHGVAGLRIVMVNVYTVSAPDSSWVLIDAGLYLSAGKIRAGWNGASERARGRPRFSSRMAISIMSERSRTSPRNGTFPCTRTRSRCRI